MKVRQQFVIAMVLSAGLCGCAQRAGEGEPRRPAHVLGHAVDWKGAQGLPLQRMPPATRQAPVPAKPASRAIVMPPGLSRPQRERPLYQLRLDASSPDRLVQSIASIESTLPEDEATGFRAATRVVMATSLPQGVLQGQSGVSDSDIWTSILPILHGRSAWDVIVLAKKRLEELPPGTVEGSEVVGYE